VTNATLLSSGALFSQWRTQRDCVDAQIAALRRVIAQSAAAPGQNLAELASCARALADRMRDHFRSEAETYEALKEELGCVEVDTAKRQAEADQVHLLARVTLICEQLEGSHAELAVSPEAMIEKLDWLFDDLDQHQERECESIEWLSQHGCG
jgi:hypothetical protein